MTPDEEKTAATAIAARQLAIAKRLILARITDDDAAFNATANEVGDCAEWWWRVIAESLAVWIATDMQVRKGKDKAAVAMEQSIAELLDEIDEC